MEPAELEVRAPAAVGALRHEDLAGHQPRVAPAALAAAAVRGGLDARAFYGPFQALVREAVYGAAVAVDVQGQLVLDFRGLGHYAVARELAADAAAGQ